MIEVTKRHDAQFPIGVVLNAKPVQKFTLKAAKELQAKLSDAIEWAVNMDDLRKENHQESNAQISGGIPSAESDCSALNGGTK